MTTLNIICIILSTQLYIREMANMLVRRRWKELYMDFMLLLLFFFLVGQPSIDEEQKKRFK